MIGKHILLVDDNADVTHLMRIILEDDSHKVSVLDAGRGVHDYVLTDPPELIVLDMRLGDISGITVLSELKSDPQTAAIPIIVYTASPTDFEKTQRLIAAEPSIYGGTRVLKKPFDLDELFEFLRQEG